VAAKKIPNKIELVCYNVGFGDCTLLTFRYPDASKEEDKHVLIDFGSKGLPAHLKKAQLMKTIAKDIEKRCRPRLSDDPPKLDVLVATHRHEDHISSFGQSPGDTIGALEPGLVIQPWTEDPKAAPDPTAHAFVPETGSDPDRSYLAALTNMQLFAQAIKEEAGRHHAKGSDQLHRMVEWVGDENLKNEDAVKRLYDMGKRGRQYVSFRSRSKKLADALPGVKVTFLGPPKASQIEAITDHGESYDDQLWLTSRFWGLQARSAEAVGKGRRLFPDADAVVRSDAPPYARWLIDQVEEIRTEQLLGIVTELHNAWNNTSVIMLFEVGDQVLLFSGDAEVSSWMHALRHSGVKEKLEKVTLYKVGHHGSRNATPKDLWKAINPTTAGDPDRDFRIVLSTDKERGYGKTEETRVPHKELLKALQKAAMGSRFRSTDGLKAKSPYGGKWTVVRIDVGK
jgi:hypothetical protein